MEKEAQVFHTSPTIGTGLNMPTVDGNTTSQLPVLEDRPYPHITQQLVMWILPIPMVLLNIVVFIVVPRMKTRHPCAGYGMMSLAAADFCLGLANLIRMSYNTYTDYQLQEDHAMCIADGYFMALFASISIVTLAFMNVDRLLSVAFPLKYARQMSKQHSLSVYISIWIFLICFMAPTITGAAGTSIKYYEYAFICVPDWAGDRVPNLITLVMVNVIPTFVVAACFSGIFYFARTKSKELKSSGSGRGVQVHKGQGGASNNEEFQRDLRIFKTLAIMTFGFYLAWTPYFVMVGIPELITGRSLNRVADFITPWLAASNSFWNPIIYVPTMRHFYTAMMQLYDRCIDACCLRCRRKECSGDLSSLKTTPTSSSASGNSGSAPVSSKDTGSTEITSGTMKETAFNAV